MKRLLLLAIAALLALPAAAQISISGLPGGTYTQGFDDYTGAGFSPTPSTGQLDSDDFAVSGNSDGDVDFGGTSTSGDNARGTAAAGVSSGGVYAFTSATGPTLGVQPAGSDFTPGAFYVRFRNDTGSAITDVSVSYDIYVRNDQSRSNSFDLGYATGTAVTAPAGLTYTEPGGDFDYVSPEASSGSSLAVAASPSGTLAGITIAAGDDLVLRFYSDDVSGGGSRDEIALDNLEVTFAVGSAEETVTAPLAGRYGADGVENNGAGWRLLGMPVEGVDVADLAAINLVQGVPAGAENGPQFPSGADILLSAVNAAGTDYDSPDDTDYVFEPGDGFFWYWYDNNTVPNEASFGGGTSRSYENASVDLSVTGTVPTSDVTQEYPLQAAATNAYMIANPFDEDLATGASGIEVSGIGTGTVQADLSVWDPADGTFSTLARDDANVLAVFQGAFIEVAEPSGAGPATVTFLAAGRSGDATTELPARRAPDRLSLVLEGDLVSGTHVVDRAAQIRAVEGAGAGWDVYDLTKLYPPPSHYALLAPTSTRDGFLYRQSVYSISDELAGSTEVRVGFLATTQGRFTITPVGLRSLPAGWSATLYDAVMGKTVTLAEGTPYVFEAVATAGWEDRFTVSLVSGATAAGPDAAAAVRIGEVYPNPAVGQARLSVEVDQAQRVALTVFDAVGRRVSVAVAELAAGEARLLTLPTSDLAPGVYVVRVAGTTFAESRRLVVTR